MKKEKVLEKKFIKKRRCNYKVMTKEASVLKRKSVSKLLKIILVTIQSQNSKPMFFSSAYIGS
ncbi:MAG: hypothetical protein Q7U04_02405 [Bacteriovorax sp.]|nr:hypothetical protein [Bacteriovorax sp.]